MNKIAVFFPGIGYHCDKPLLHYGRDIAVEMGYRDFKNIWYSTHDLKGEKKKVKETFSTLYGQAEEALKEMDWYAYDEILFVSKSIGTAIASAYAGQHELKGVRHVLYTPLMETFDYHPQNAVAFIGSADPWSDVSQIQETCDEQQIPLFIYEGADHSLETEDTLVNLDIMKEVMRKTRDFMSRGM